MAPPIGKKVVNQLHGDGWEEQVKAIADSIYNPPKSSVAEDHAKEEPKYYSMPVEITKDDSGYVIDGDALEKTFKQLKLDTFQIYEAPEPLTFLKTEILDEQLVAKPLTKETFNEGFKAIKDHQLKHAHAMPVHPQEYIAFTPEPCPPKVVFNVPKQRHRIAFTRTTDDCHGIEIDMMKPDGSYGYVSVRLQVEDLVALAGLQQSTEQAKKLDPAPKRRVPDRVGFVRKIDLDS